LTSYVQLDAALLPLALALPPPVLPPVPLPCPPLVLGLVGFSVLPHPQSKSSTPNVLALMSTTLRRRYLEPDSCGKLFERRSAKAAASAGARP
jgi:hypothetical protein